MDVVNVNMTYVINVIPYNKKNNQKSLQNQPNQSLNKKNKKWKSLTTITKHKNSKNGQYISNLTNPQTVGNEINFNVNYVISLQYTHIVWNNTYNINTIQLRIIHVMYVVWNLEAVLL